MNIWLVSILIIGIFIIVFLIFSLPRKKNKRQSSIEGLDSSEVARAFEKMASFFPFKILRRKILSELDKCDLNGLFLDVGCGSGHLIVQIAQKFENLDLIGIDISDEILDLAKKRAVKIELNKKVEFKKANVENLPFPDNSVDFIISSLSLHHWSDPKLAFKELLRILKREGTLLIFDFRRDSRKFFYGLLTFATKVVVPKALKEIKEPLGSLKAGYIAREVREILSKVHIENIEIKPYLAWMFIYIKKNSNHAIGL